MLYAPVFRFGLALPGVWGLATKRGCGILPAKHKTHEPQGGAF